MLAPADFQPKRIVVLGLGYVGCVSAACLASLGHTVAGVDPDEFKVRQIGLRRAPFREPGLDELIEKAIDSGRLSSTVNLAEALPDADIALICVGTPSERNGDINVEHLRRVASEIGAVSKGRTRPLVVAVRSTAFPGTCEEIVVPAVADNPAIGVICNPEFLREGAAIRDFLEPSLIVVGGENPEAVRAAASIYAPLPGPVALVSLRTAEMIKYACNAFHALKIAFANEIGTLAARNGVSAGEVMETLCRDTRLNISAAYLKPGFAFGGSCLPKDLRALTYRAARLDLDLPLIESILPSNQNHLSRAVQSVLDLPAGQIGVFGLAFKENTDDLRESPVVAMIETLIGKGRALRIFDPNIRIGAIYGSNRSFVLAAIPHIGNLMVDSVEEMIAGSAAIVVTQPPSPEATAAIQAAGVPTMDLTRL